MDNRNPALEALLDAVGDGPPAWTTFDGPPGGADGFTLRPGTDGLIGYRAAPTVRAVGLVADGTAHHLDGHGSWRCRVACVVERTGATAGTVVDVDGAEVAGAPDAGRLLDALRRCLGLPTPPPSQVPAVVLTTLWVLAAAGAAQRRQRILGPAAALALHPAGPNDAEPALRWSWDDVRARVVAGDLHLPGVDAALAGWMDAGMLSRWVADEVPGLADPSALLAGAVTDDALARLSCLILPSGVLSERTGSCPPLAAPGPGHRPRAMPRN